MRTLTTTATAAAAAICTTVTVTVTATAPAHLARAVGINALTCSHRPVECVNTKLSACARLSLSSVHMCVSVRECVWVRVPMAAGSTYPTARCILSTENYAQLNSAATPPLSRWHCLCRPSPHNVNPSAQFRSDNCCRLLRRKHLHCAA